LAARGFNGVTTIETASQSYQSISTQIQSLRVNVAARRVDASTASWQLQSFSSQASLILQAINGCGRCYNRNYVVSDLSDIFNHELFV
jgi:16S rRNA G966 N2-methylase RsmD